MPLPLSWVPSFLEKRRSNGEVKSRCEKQTVATQHAEMKANVEFTVNGKPTETVEEFEYLGRVVTKHDNENQQ
jgi:hypothetical protein